MQISEINNKDELSALIINELKDIGVKYRKDKKSKVVQEKTCRKRIFRTHLHLLELTDVILINGGVVQIPKFVADSCNRILEQVETEGIFRKAGSAIRQKEIRVNLEAGLSLGKLHHVIDVANLVKSFFRELPEPLIPSSLQETLLRSLLIEENQVKAILLTCLLLPPLTINTLAFFMQFLHTVSQSSHLNKMSIENLAIIFTPGIMPFSDITSHRFNNHVKMVHLLIENAYSIGTIPDCIIDKLQIHEVISNTPFKSRSFEALEIVTQKKKKKRRSGSLTQMFNGLRKIVGSAIGSSENLENTPEHKTANSNALATDQQQKKNSVNTAATPCIKSTKKRKFTEPVCAFSAKKKKDLLALLPSSSGGFLPNTPLTKEPKKSRLSLAGRKHIKNISNNTMASSMERRWSIVGSGWSKSKKSATETKKDTIENKDFSSETSSINHLSSVISMPCFSKIDLPAIEHPVVENLSFVNSASCTDCREICVELSDADYVQIPKFEYQAMKERVAAIETRISQEFGSICKTLQRTSFSSTDEVDKSLSGPERVENKYNQVITDTEILTSPTTEHLAQRLSRGLNIRRSSENRIMRSPSARKIGTIRRRSQEKVRLSRNQTWHICSTANKLPLNKCEILPVMPLNCFYSKRNLKRGRPNTMATGLHQHQQQCTPAIDSKYAFDETISNENWTDGQNFFNVLPRGDIQNQCSKTKTQQFNDDACTPMKQACNNVNNIKTPMLPPKSIPRKMDSSKSSSSSIKLSSTSKNDVKNLTLESTSINEDGNVRASIARLRAQNAGMVMAKAKLFDELGRNHCSEDEIDSALTQPHDIVHHRNSFGMSSSNNLKKKNSLEIRRKTSSTAHVTTSLDSPPGLSEKKNFKCKSPFIVQKCQKPALPTRFPNKNLLNTVLSDKSLIQPRKGCEDLNIGNFTHNKQKYVTHTSASSSCKEISVNSPRRARTNRVVLNHSRTHIHLKSIQRNSPKQVKIKSNSKKVT